MKDTSRQTKKIDTTLTTIANADAVAIFIGHL